MLVCGRLKGSELPFYLVGQLLGSFIASALCFAIYRGKFLFSVALYLKIYF